ncbi:MAG: hypothetical protein CM15mP125_3810 [Gammaproteobacteria bacterium]|nr:MAG: hypothetical protein CM15mP125_3810 [Gammaproteobacteria bacterium]
MAAIAPHREPLATALPATWRNLRALCVSPLVNSRVMPLREGVRRYRVVPPVRQSSRADYPSALITTGAP